MSRGSYGEAAGLLEARGQEVGFGIKPDLGRIQALTDLLDHPERTYPAIHITGTNGKSTTARMIGSILAAHGLKCGVYTSPHLQSVRERFTLSGPGPAGVVTEEISPDDFAATLFYLLPFIETVEQERRERVTYFETTTILAIEWMAQQTVDAAIVEVGMGGRWDATNVVDGQVAVITTVAVDHSKFLGSTPVEIAAEKVGIIKPGSRVVSAAQDPEVLALIERSAKEGGFDPALLSRDFAIVEDEVAIGGRTLSLQGLHGNYGDLFIPVHGSHQSGNAALAVAACEQFLGRALDTESVVRGLAAVRSPGRLEVVGHRPTVVLDGAHNPAGASALASALDETFGARRVTFVVAAFEDKDLEGILGALIPRAGRLIFTTIQSPRSAQPSALDATAGRLGASGETVESLAEAIEVARSGSEPEDLVVVTGSLYTAGAARDHLVGPVQ